jgi:mono/diheme cytochrome c family protein
MKNAMRTAAAVVALAAATGCKPMDDVMVAVFGRSMRDQRSFDPYENTLPPPENSLSFSSGNFPAALGQVNIGHPEEAMIPRFGAADMFPVGTGNELVAAVVNPVPADSASLARGEVMYVRMCAVCHGDDGFGANAYIAGKHPTIGIFNLAGAQVAGYTDSYIYGIVRFGRALMPEYGSRIAHFDRWHIVNYIRELQRRNAAAQPAPGQ